MHQAAGRLKGLGHETGMKMTSQSRLASLVPFAPFKQGGLAPLFHRHLNKVAWPLCFTAC